MSDHAETCETIGPEPQSADGCPFAWRHADVAEGRHVHSWTPTRWDGRMLEGCECGAARVPVLGFRMVAGL